MRSLAAAEQIAETLPFASAPLRARWDEARALAARLLGDARAHELPELPPLTPEQRRPVQHRLGRAVATTSRFARGARNEKLIPGL